MKKYLTFILIIVFTILGFYFKQQMVSKLPFDQFVEYNINKARVPGIGIGVIKDGRIHFNQGYGLQNIEESIKVSNDTIFLIASVSKLVTATGLMQLYENGLFKLDDSINDYLDFKVLHHKYPEDHITFRMLLSHTSGLRDAYGPYENLYTIYSGGGDTEIKLERFVKEYLQESGEYYSEDENFYDAKPGEQYEYANINFALIGYLIQKLSGENFEDYIQKNIFDPLEMRNSSWLVRNTDLSKTAVPYNNEGRSFEAFKHYSHPSYPDGFIRTTIDDFSKFLMAVMNNGRYKNNRILESETVQEMLQIQKQDHNEISGLGWDLCSYEQDDEYCTQDFLIPGHDGGDFGVSSLVFFNPNTQIGYLFFMNADMRNDQNPQENKYIRSIINRVMKDNK